MCDGTLLCVATHIIVCDVCRDTTVFVATHIVCDAWRDRILCVAIHIIVCDVSGTEMCIGTQ